MTEMYYDQGIPLSFYVGTDLISGEMFTSVKLIDISRWAAEHHDRRRIVPVTLSMSTPVYTATPGRVDGDVVSVGYGTLRTNVWRLGFTEKGHGNDHRR